MKTCTKILAGLFLLCVLGCESAEQRYKTANDIYEMELAELKRLEDLRSEESINGSEERDSFKNYKDWWENGTYGKLIKNQEEKLKFARKKLREASRRRR